MAPHAVENDQNGVGNVEPRDRIFLGGASITRFPYRPSPVRNVLGPYGHNAAGLRSVKPKTKHEKVAQERR
jgi:hypothetical protein